MSGTATRIIRTHQHCLTTVLPDGDGKRVPWAYLVPKGVPDLIGMAVPRQNEAF
jgi:hypothetical protein